MARAKKDGVKVSYILEKELAELLDKFCEETGLSKTVTVEKALKMYLEAYQETGKLN